jgi:DNA polymerase elongation subunit (family B)
MELTDFEDISTEETLHVMSVEYEEQFGDPLVHLWCRTEDGDERWVEVSGHKPSFFIEQEAFTKRVKNHNWVCGHDTGDWETLHGDDLVRVFTKLPWHVGGKDGKKGLREYFDNTWEADVFFTTRFLIDNEIKTHFTVDTEDTWEPSTLKGDYRVDVDDIESADVDWKATPRMVTLDIEVESPDGFPDPSEAKQPVTAVTAHDNYSDAYTVWVLRYDGWAYSDTEISNIAIENRPDGANIEDVRVFENEAQMLDNLNTYIADRAPDLLSGWNSSTTDNGNPFDYPYLINRCKSLNTYSYEDWSPLGQVWDGSWGPRAKGVEFFDMLKSYKKTQWQKPKGGYGLDNISSKEGVAEKLEIEDIDNAWRDDMATFLEYNIRDVQAVVEIDRSAGVLDLFQNLRQLTGAQFDNCHNNIDLLDQFIIRYAHDMGVALPTNEKPERGWYYGAHVFEPKIGRHPNVVYPDLWSMYPNMIRNANMSPETIIGTAADLERSEWTEDDCRWTYIDTRQTNVKKDSDPQYEKVYFLKPSIKEGFMTEVVDDLMGMKDYYDGTALYDAVKRVVNSVYGVYGDSDSYGKGYRLFDWRIAEGICLGGRKMIQDSADRFIDAVNEIKDERGIEGNKAYLVGGDTDSVMTSIPFMAAEDYDDYEEIVDLAWDAADRVNDWYGDWTAETFNVRDGRHYCELEIESYAPWAFVPKGKTKEKAKKRYAEIIAWDEGDWEDPPEFSVTGIDIVRSDRAEVTRDVAQDVIDTILRVDDRDDARKQAYDAIATNVEAIQDGEVENSYIARPKGMSKHPEQYGSTDKTPVPTYRGAKYANQNFQWENMTAGAKPQLLYLDRVRGDWPRTYSAETKEDGADVDAVAVENPNKVPDEFVVDTDKQIEKVLEDPLTPILEAMRWDFDESLSDTSQGSLAEFM